MSSTLVDSPPPPAKKKTPESKMVEDVSSVKLK